MFKNEKGFYREKIIQILKAHGGQLSHSELHRFLVSEVYGKFNRFLFDVENRAINDLIKDGIIKKESGAYILLK